MKVGIITMHRVMNFGSVLQAYALQEAIRNCGFEVEIIDYQYPNQLHLCKSNNSLLKKIVNILKKIGLIYLYLILGTNKLRMKKFIKHKLCLSRSYKTQTSIKNNPPKYDIYVTGSDQVWNPRFSYQDDVFMLSFVKGNKKMSYAASIAATHINESYKSQLRQFLSEYDSIAVRELSSKKNLEEILNRKINLTCDPTLLLTKKEWQDMGKKSKIKIKSKYVLLYILTYSYNPYPKLDDFINQFEQETGLYPVFLLGSYRRAITKNGKFLFRVGPEDFISLIDNADFIITTSFHGVCFSVKLQKQFYALAKSSTDFLDERLVSFLRTIGAENRLLYEDNNYKKDLKMNIDYNENINQALEDYISNSYSYLETTLNQIKKASSNE